MILALTKGFHKHVDTETTKNNLDYTLKRRLFTAYLFTIRYSWRILFRLYNVLFGLLPGAILRKKLFVIVWRFHMKRLCFIDKLSLILL